MEKTSQYLSIGHYSPLTIRNYLAELRFIFVNYPDADPVDLTEAMITQYSYYVTFYISLSLPLNLSWCYPAVLCYARDLEKLNGRNIFNKEHKIFSQEERLF